MNLRDYQNTIFIIKDKAKKGLLKRINSEHNLLNIKLITLSELKKKYFFDYTKEAIFYVSQKYNVISDVAEIYIKNLYYLKNIDDEKVKFLTNIKKDLEAKKLLKANPFFHNYLKNKTIVLYDLENVDDFYKNIFNELKKNNRIIEYNIESDNGIKKLYCAKNKDEEISFIASSIVKLIKNGIDINNILLANVQSNYQFCIENIFKDFNIPLELPSNSSINGTMLVKKFKDLYKEDMQEVFEELKNYVNDDNEGDLYLKLVDIVNDYAWCNSYIEVKDMIFKDIENTKLKSNKLKNAVRTIDFMDDIINDDKYVFLINFNQGSIPKNYKNEDYLSDDVRSKLNISTSIDLNIKAIKEIQKRIKTTKNLIVTYSKHDVTNELYISNAFNEVLFDPCEIVIDYTESNGYNKLRLLSAMDEYKKYGTNRTDLSILSNHYKDFNYFSYKNDYTGIKTDKIKSFINNKLILSYTNMNTYYQCGFKYYLEYILKVDKYEDNFQTIIGNIFHEVLSIAFLDDFNFENSWMSIICKQTYKLNNMEKFFLNNLKEELYLVIDTIKDQLKNTSLKKALYEKEILIPIDENLNIYFKGYIDKVLYDKFDGKIIAIVIDYKTGNPDINFDGIPYGLNMQLPIYIYLLQHTSEIKNVKIGGFYLQKILSNSSDKEKRMEGLKLLGYSNSDLDVLEKVDNSYVNSKIIKGMKMTSNGLSSYAKTLSDRDMNKLSKIIDEKIKESARNILNGEFIINPKELNGSLIGCKYCKFKDICYLKNADIVKLKSISKNEILGGEDNA